MNRFVQRMNEVERDLGSPYVRPKDAATLILVDRSGRGAQGAARQAPSAATNSCRANSSFRAAGSTAADKRMPVARPLDPHAEAHLCKALRAPERREGAGFCARGDPRDIRGDRTAAWRASSEVAKVPDGPWTAFAQAKILPDLGALHFIGRAITPPGRPRRFDARFFTLDASAIAHRVEGVTGPDAELVELVWMPLDGGKQLDMPAVTGVMLEELDARIADGFGHDLPVPFYSMPRGRFMRELL